MLTEAKLGRGKEEEVRGREINRCESAELRV